MFQRGVSEGRFRGVFQRGVSDPWAALRSDSVSCTQEAILLRFLLPKDKSAKGPAQRDSSLKISAEDGLDVPVGNLACSFPATMLGKPCFRGWCFRGVFQEGCLRGVFQRGGTEGRFREVFQRGVSDPWAALRSDSV